MTGLGASDGRAPAEPSVHADESDLHAASVRSAPVIGRRASLAEGLGLALGLIGATAIGSATIFSLAAHKQPVAAKAAIPTVPAPSPPPSVAVLPGAPVPLPTPTTPPALAATAPAPPPLLVLDNSTPPTLSGASAPNRAAPGSSASGLAKPEANLSPEEQFSARAGDESVPTSHAHRLDHPGKIVPQGTVIPAVLETALNSDLPGYARALVSGDVRSFDGSHLLIPRGSRLIGQYKSALQSGQSRALIVWNRLLRPDGISIQLGSPATDDLGQTGLAGKVDSHFFQRYGSAILLSVIDGLAGAVGGSGNTVVLGSVSGSTGAAGVALQNQIKIPPTVRILQGTPIQVFAARDLDFTEDGR